jgi:hypothetical protein
MHFRTVVGLSLAVLAAGCGKDEVRVYEVAKETNSPASTAAMEAEPAPAPRATAAAGPSAGSPKVPWTIPPEWKERPNASGMRLASYGVTAADGRSVDISVTALGEQAGTELDNVNRWRGQLKLNPLTEDQLAMARDPVKIGGEPSHLYDIVSEEPMLDGKYKSRVLASILPTGQMTVFFKAIGEADLVAAEKVRFIGWLASVKTGPDAGGDEGSAPPAAAAAPAPTAPPRPPAAPPSLPPGPSAELPKWKVPSHWIAGGPRAMRLASFEIPGDGNASGDLSISTLASGGGGLLANVNRWRGQVGLTPTDEASLAKEAQTITLPGRQKATVVDLGGASANRILGAIVPDGDKSWFFKLSGPDALVVKERENFLAWLKSIEL